LYDGLHRKLDEIVLIYKFGDLHTFTRLFRLSVDNV